MLPVLALTGCDGGDEGDQSVILEVTMTFWSGWDPHGKPTPETETFELAVGDDFTILHGSDEVTFEVTTLTSDTIEFALSKRMSPVGPSGGIDLLDPKDHFSLDRDGTLEMATPTMDEGTNVTIKEVDEPADDLNDGRV